MNRRWWVLVLLCLAQFMVILDVTVVNVSLPVIGDELALSRAAATWVITGYTLCFGGLMLLGGRLADVFGRRRTFLLGLTVFTVASLASGLADSATMLVTARAAQGVGAALLSPAALSIITTTFHGRDRNRALGVWAAIGGSGAAVGVVLGGLLTAGPGWQWVFYINIPVGIAVAAMLPVLLPSSVGNGGRVDLPGALLVTSAAAAFIYGLVTAGDAGWGAPETLVPLVSGIVLAAGFVLVQRRAVQPLVRLSLLSQRPMVAGIVIMIAATGMLIGSFFLASMYLQRVLDLSALRTGLLFLPVAVAITIGAHLASRLVARFGARIIAGFAFGLATIGLAWLSRLPAGGDALTDLLPGFALAGLGLGAGFVSATITALAHVDHHDAGVASGTINTSHELGASLGAATVSTIAGASLATAAGLPVPIAGFDNAFLALAVAALVLVGLIVWLVPGGRPPVHDGPVFAH